MTSIHLSSWEQIPIQSISNFLTHQSTTALFLEVLKNNNVDLKTYSSYQITQMYAEVDWSFIYKLPKFPIVACYNYKGKNLYIGNENMKSASAIEFYLAEHYYQAYVKTNDVKNLTNLFFTLYRPKVVVYTQSARRFRKVYDFNHKVGDDRVKINSQAEIEKLAEGAQIDSNALAAAYVYAHANLSHITSTYGAILSAGGDGSKSSASSTLGWPATFMSIAEAGIFGNFDEVMQTNIHTIFAYMIKKTMDNQDHKNSLKKT